VSADPTTRWRGREGRVWVDSGYRPCASASIATPELGRAKTLPLRSSHGTGPTSAESWGPSVPDLVRLIVLSCPFYGVTPPPAPIRSPGSGRPTRHLSRHGTRNTATTRCPI